MRPPLRAQFSKFALAASFALVACTNAASPAPELAITTDDVAISGTFTDSGSFVKFHSESRDQQAAALRLDVNGVAFDVDLDFTRGTFSEDGYHSAFYEAELAVLLRLRDTLNATRPELRTTLQGTLLIREIDRLAETPMGLTLDRHVVDLNAEKSSARSVDADGCGDDGTTCLPGTSGSTFAVYDAGSDGTCQWKATSYGGSSCAGRCGAGCNLFDNDYMWDCLDHDRCVDAFGGSVLSGNVNCGDEFWDAADDYVVTYGPYCFSGSKRSGPPKP